MARTPTPRGRLLLLASVALLASSTLAESTCYNTWGEVDTNQQPCLAPGTADTGATTWCCSKTDYCLTNGLCLSPGSSNLMTQQGCTDQNWGGSCKKFCPASNAQKLAAIPLIPCASTYSSTTTTLKFCCGPDASSCCTNTNTNTNTQLTLPAGTLLSTTSSSSSDNNNYSLKIGLGIGLGIGLPILLVLCAVAYLLATPLHKRRHRHRHANPGSDTTTEKTSTTSPENPDKGDPGSPKKPKPTPHRERAKRAAKAKRRKSFGQVDTSVAPESDSDDGLDFRHHRHHRGQHHDGSPAAVAAWARSPFGFHVGVGEVDGRGARVRPAELGGEESEVKEMGGGGGAGGGGERWMGRGVRVAGEEVELPTPDTGVLGSSLERDVEMGFGRGMV